MDKCSDIVFIRTCRFIYEDEKVLTPEYALQLLKKNKIVQINLDNCSLQRMEKLSSTATLNDVQRVGLLPLVQLLQTGVVCLTAIGVNEMPDSWVEKSMIAYQNFCRLFWPSHVDDPEATFRDYSSDPEKNKVLFNSLPDESRTVYGFHYVSMLQIQNIRLNYKSFTPEKKFETYLYSIISLIGIVSAYDLEIAKYAFWSIDSNTINKLPEKIKQRRQYIKKNFLRNGSSLEKCRNHAFDAAMDLHWLTGANLSEDINLNITIGGKKFSVEHWVGTNDLKLYHIAKDIYHIYHEGVTMKRLISVRENELSAFTYWEKVDRLAKDVLGFREQSTKGIPSNFTECIDLAVKFIEKELSNYFDSSSKEISS
jgi:hypothetical protein